MSATNDTPETDSATLIAEDIECGGRFEAVHVKVSKRLERQRNELLEALKVILKDYKDAYIEWDPEIQHRKDPLIERAESAIAKVTTKP